MMNSSLKAESEPIEFFQLLLTEDLLREICLFTNQKAKQKIDNYKRRKQNMVLWKDCNLEEMKTFLGVLMSIGIVRLPSIMEYWKSETKFFVSKKLFLEEDFWIFTLAYALGTIKENAPLLRRFN